MGVKSLWSLLTPVGRPVLLETTEGKVMAIDSSIWIYQFQATMKDKDGRTLVNAHVLGFLRRISKLLFYGIKPVFVFDGGAPTLKRNTLRGRREKKSGAAANHAKLAEKLLAAQMRREALSNTVTSGQRPTTKGKEKSAQVNNDKTVYLEDIEPSMAKTPARKKIATPPSSSSKKAKFYDHDPYKLPEVDLEAAVAKATRTVAPDPRLATEEELRTFIEEMRPEDFDVTSPAFRELPTEVQYEIVGDLRLKSRQTSHARLQKMLRNAPTPLDFSKQQIKNLRQRNTLTQQLLITTDSIGSAHISIPVRIASERNKEYILMKNEGESGGWILGIRNEGTQEKPIEIDQEEDDRGQNDSDEEMEEVPISVPVTPDPDLREYQRSMALSSIGNRSGQKQSEPALRPTINRKYHNKPLFALDDDEETAGEADRNRSLDLSDDDDLLALVIQESIDQRNSQQEFKESHARRMSPPPNTPPITVRSVTRLMTDDNFTSEPPSRLETALSFANAGSTRSTSQSSHPIFGRSTLLSSPSQLPATAASTSQGMPKVPLPIDEGEMVLVDNNHSPSISASSEASQKIKSNILDPELWPPTASQVIQAAQTSEADQLLNLPQQIPLEPLFESLQEPATAQDGSEAIDSEDEMEEVALGYVPTPSQRPIVLANPLASQIGETVHDYALESSQDPEATTPQNIVLKPPATKSERDDQGIPSKPPYISSLSPLVEQDDDLIPWSRSPSPSNELPTDPVNRPESSADADFDAAKEMDPHAEEGEYARFISQVKGKNIEDVRREIDDEIRSLNQQKKAAMRDSEDITQQMIAQIMTMLRLFGIPYMTAPMEAEAQCAELVTLGLVDGVITDDSDVFLFGAKRVFKNMFNQSKTVECFLLPDLSRELGLERETLIRLAYLLGSDYVDGLPGVGPVVAMELLKEFPGEEGLAKFKEWWVKVQTGKDKQEDNKSRFRKRFKKKFKSLYLSDDWPNPAVRDAYLHPAVDSSDEPFKWGLPDLDALRMFFKTELGWGQVKVDEILLPLIQKMNKRGQEEALNKQGNLGDFFDMPSGSGTLAPRKRQAYTSKRLQDVVDDLRKKRKQLASTSSTEGEEDRPTQAQKRSKTSSRRTGKQKSRSSSPRSMSSKKTTKGKELTLRARAKKARKQPETDDEDDIKEADAGMVTIHPDPIVAQRLRPRPRLKAKSSVSEGSQNDDGDI